VRKGPGERSPLMVASLAQNLPSSLERAYYKADAALRVRQAKVCSVLSLVLVPACVGLDYIVYPNLVWRIFVARLLCDLALLPCFLALFTKWGRRNVRMLGNAPPLIPAITICWMIYASEGVLSPYYAGLNIVMAGVILLIPYNLGEAIVICSIVLLCYTLACILHRVFPPSLRFQTVSQAGASPFINNIYFLLMTAVIALAACHYSSVRRFQEFRLRFELDVNNRELASTLKKLQETEVQLVQSEKMNALGKLSAGLLHEINNPLNYTFMALQVAKQEAVENESLCDTLKDIGEGMERIRTVIADLRGFAYPTDHLNSQDFPLDESLTTAVKLTAHELGSIRVEREGLNDVIATGATTQIVQVFMNLLINSAHALKEKGKDAIIKVRCSTDGGRLKLTVRDNGTGVSAANLPKLLDPFFTTKAPGQGMGLGLSICHTIVQNHGGSMHVSSEEGQWTEVSFDLPQGAASKRSAA
jgi:two-component system, sensor histidine kinase PhcS